MGQSPSKVAQQSLLDIGYRAYSLVAAAVATTTDPEVKQRGEALLTAYMDQIGTQIAEALQMCDNAAYATSRIFYWRYLKQTRYSPFPPQYGAVFAPVIP